MIKKRTVHIFIIYFNGFSTYYFDNKQDIFIGFVNLKLSNCKANAYINL